MNVFGTGVAGFQGDGGAPENAEFNQPTAVAYTGYNGDFLVADSGNYRVRAMDLYRHVITTIAGNGTPSWSGDGGQATAAQLGNPYAVAFDGAGNEYVADDQNAAIRKISPAGVITTVVGTGIAGFAGDGGPAASAQLNDPRGVAVDASGDIAISDTGNQRIRWVDHMTGVITTIAGTGNSSYNGDGSPGSSFDVNFPEGLVIGPDQDVYVADTGNNRIRKIVVGGGITTAAGAGVAGFLGDGGQATLAELNGPRGVTFDSEGNLYISDSLNNRVRRVDHVTATIGTFAGDGVAGHAGDGRSATAGELNFPFGIVFDAAGDLFIADTKNQRIRMVGPSGHLSTVLGLCAKGGGFSGDAGPAAVAQVNFPFGLGVDVSGDVYVADVNNNRVREVITPTGLDRFTCPAAPVAAPPARGASQSNARLPGPRLSTTPNFRGRSVPVTRPLAVNQRPIRSATVQPAELTPVQLHTAAQPRARSADGSRAHPASSRTEQLTLEARDHRSSVLGPSTFQVRAGPAILAITAIIALMLIEGLWRKRRRSRVKRTAGPPAEG